MNILKPIRKIVLKKNERRIEEPIKSLELINMISKIKTSFSGIDNRLGIA